MAEGYTVDAVVKALRLLEVVSASEASMTLSEIAREAGLPKTTAFRYAQTLAAAGFLGHDRHHDCYSSGARLRMLAAGAVSAEMLRRAAAPRLAALSERHGETANLAVRSGRMLVYVDVICVGRRRKMEARIGERHPLHTTALGKSMLAFLPAIERRAALEAQLEARTSRTLQSEASIIRELRIAARDGCALERCETEDGLSCIGAPILDERGYPIGAISLVTAENRFDALYGRAWRDICDTARAISSDLILPVSQDSSTQ